MTTGFGKGVLHGAILGVAALVVLSLVARQPDGCSAHQLSDPHAVGMPGEGADRTSDVDTTLDTSTKLDRTAASRLGRKPPR